MGTQYLYVRTYVLNVLLDDPADYTGSEDLLKNIVEVPKV